MKKVNPFRIKYSLLFRFLFLCISYSLDRTSHNLIKENSLKFSIKKMKTWTGYYNDADYCPTRIRTHENDNNDTRRISKRQRHTSIHVCNLEPPVTKDASKFRNNQRVYYVNDGAEFDSDGRNDTDDDTDDDVVWLGSTRANPHLEEQDNATRDTEEEEKEEDVVATAEDVEIINTLKENFEFNYVEGICNICDSHHNVIDRGCCDYKMCKGCFTTWMYSSGNNKCTHCKSSQHPNIPSGFFLMFKRCFAA